MSLGSLKEKADLLLVFFSSSSSSFSISTDAFEGLLGIPLVFFCQDAILSSSLGKAINFSNSLYHLSTGKPSNLGSLCNSSNVGTDEDNNYLENEIMIATIRITCKITDKGHWRITR